MVVGALASEPVLARELSRLIGREQVLEVPASSPYNRDAAGRREAVGRAGVVVLPASAEQAAQVLQWCYAHDVGLVPRGGGTGMMGGALAGEEEVLCSMERLRGVRELEPSLWRMYVEAGLNTADVHRLARENGLMFAPDPGASEQSQIAGNVSTNAGGPHALKYGVTGNWVAGLEVALAPGELVEVGGWAAKDVAGYDLRSLLIGSEGTLGLITAVRLRLLPRPPLALPAVALLRDRAEGCAAIEQLLGSGLRPSVLDFLDGDVLAMMAASFPESRPVPGSMGGAEALGEAGFALLIEVDGTDEEARVQLAEVGAALGEQAVAILEPQQPADLWRWRDGFNGVVASELGAKVSEDVVFPLESLGKGLERFEAIASGNGLRSCSWGHGGEGNVHATVLVDPASERDLQAAERTSDGLFELVVELGGSVAGEHGVGLLKGGRLAAQWAPRAVELHEQIKHVFDPKGLLNPGKKLARYPASPPIPN